MYTNRLEEKTGSAAKRWKDGDRKKMFGGAGAAAAGICGDLTTGRVSIMYSVKQPGGSWGQATPVD
jgi:hypothetical protein